MAPPAVVIDCDPGHDMTVVDLRDLAVISAGNADVAISADSARALDLLYETVSAL